jgi:hypothetical protein
VNRKKISKKLLVASSVLMAIVSTGTLADVWQNKTAGEKASIEGGLFLLEGDTGYKLGVNWQPNKYVNTSIGVHSYLNSNTFDSETLLLDQAENYTPEKFSPRHNEYFADIQLSYPYELNKGFALSPYILFGIHQVKTKDIVFTMVDDSGDATDTTKNNKKTFSFEGLRSTKFGLGLWLSFDNKHRFDIGGVGYSNDKDWGNFAIDDNEKGLSLSYSYYPIKEVGYKVKADSVNQFGEPYITMSVEWVFY